MKCILLHHAFSVLQNLYPKTSPYIPFTYQTRYLEFYASSVLFTQLMPYIVRTSQHGCLRVSGMETTFYVVSCCFFFVRQDLHFGGIFPFNCICY